MSYSLPLRVFHWLMAAVILSAIVVVLLREEGPGEHPFNATLMMLHKSLGLTAFALIFLRLAARLSSGTPPYQPALSRPIKIASSSAHGLLYLLMIGLPIGGYAATMLTGHDVVWFGLLPVPNLLPLNKALGHLAGQAHELGGYLLIALLATHISAALWHRLVKRDNVLQRMWP